MDEYNVYMLEDNNVLEHTLRQSLNFGSRRQESPTYLVELPESRNDAPRPFQRASSRPRASSIVNTIQLPEVIEEEQQNPLEHYVRKNVSNFRKSLAPDDFQSLIDHKALGGVDREIRPTVVNFAEPVYTDFNNIQTANRSQSPRKMDDDSKALVAGDCEYKRSRSKEIPSQLVEKTPKPKRKHHKKKDENLNLTEEAVMPMDTNVSVTHDSPFAKEQRLSHSNKRPPSRVRVMVAIESSTDELDSAKACKNESDNASRRKGSKDNHRDRSAKQNRSEENLQISYNRKREKTTEGRNRNSSSRPRRESKESHGHNRDKHDRHSIDRRTMKDDRIEPNQKTKPKGEQGSSGRRISKLSDDGFFELELLADELKRKPRSGKIRNSKESRDSSSDKEKNPKHNSTPCVYKFDESSDESSEVIPPPKSAKKSKKQEKKSPSAKRKTNPYDTDKKKLVYVMTGSPKNEDAFNKTNPNKPVNQNSPNTQNKNIRIPDRAVGGTDRKNNQDQNQGQKYLTVKAPKSATKMVAKRRYHIQIPEHGRAETWFNIRFNMDDENNVEMNYEGPVKITNYYSSNNYT